MLTEPFLLQEMDLFLNMKMVVGTATGAILEVGVGEEDAVSEAVGEGDTMDLMRTCCKMEATIMIHLLKAVVHLFPQCTFLPVFYGF